MTYYVIEHTRWDKTRSLFRTQGMSPNTAVLYLTEDAAKRAIRSAGCFGKDAKIVAINVSETELDKSHWV